MLPSLCQVYRWAKGLIHGAATFTLNNGKCMTTFYRGLTWLSHHGLLWDPGRETQPLLSHTHLYPTIPRPLGRITGPWEQAADAVISAERTRRSAAPKLTHLKKSLRENTSGTKTLRHSAAANPSAFGKPITLESFRNEFGDGGRPVRALGSSPGSPRPPRLASPAAAPGPSRRPRPAPGRRRPDAAWASPRAPAASPGT